MAGVEVSDKGGFQNHGAIREEPGHTGPSIGVQVHGRISGIAHGVGVEGLLNLMEILTGGGQAQRGVRTVQRQGQAGHSVRVHQQVVPEGGIHAVLLHVDAGKGVELAPADGLHGGDGGGDLALIPVVVHHELVDGAGAVGGIGHKLLVGVGDRILVGDAAGGQHGVVPADKHIRALFMHIAHHLIDKPALGGGAAIGFLVEEVAVEAIVIHNLNELVSHREGSVLRLLQERLNLGHIAAAGAPGETQGCNHGHAVGVGRVGELTGGAADQALFGTGPVHKRIGVLPVVEGVAQEGFGALGAGVVMVGVGQGAEHQLCLGIDHRIHHKPALPVSQRNAGPAVNGIGVRLRRPLQQGVHIEGRSDGHQGLLCHVGFVHLSRPVITGRSGKGNGGHHAEHHHQRQNRRQNAMGLSDLHGNVPPFLLRQPSGRITCPSPPPNADRCLYSSCHCPVCRA